METVKNLVEYYDELFPVTDAQQKFFEGILQGYPHPAKLLDIGCGTGTLCHRLAKGGLDVTGLETQHELLESATRKFRNQLMSLRYFQMSTLEMTRFLGKKFYNVVSCLNCRVLFIRDETLMKKFFFDARQLLTDGGLLILSLSNFQKYWPNPEVVLPEKGSVRVSYKVTVLRAEEKFYYNSSLIKSARTIPVYERAEIFPLTKEKIEGFAKEAGFSKVEFYSNFERADFLPDSDEVVAVIQ